MNVDITRVNKESYNEEEINSLIDEQIKKPYILLCGQTGVGKSSLINRVFGESLAKVNHAKPETMNFEWYTPKDKNICLCDSRGYEIGREDEYFEALLNFVHKGHVDLAWYCISVKISRFTYMDKKIIDELTNLEIPVIIVLTNIDGCDPEDLSNLKSDISKGCVNTDLFQVYSGDDENIIMRYKEHDEIKQLIERSINIIPDEKLKAGFVSALDDKNGLEQKCSYIRRKIIPTYAGVAIVTGATPIPFSDAIVLVPLQAAMSVHIIKIFGMTNATSIAKTLISFLGLEVMGKWSAKFLFSSLIKFIPSVGTVTGSVINASVAGTFTGALGYTVCEICYRYSNAKDGGVVMTLKDFLTNNTELFNIADLFKQFAENENVKKLGVEDIKKLK
ncbi:MAG: GTP-binding DUF697 domain-containing protein [Oscillospiraceae bacterium]|jgi:uncharacterized protein (DUF697 family)/predicted GTPase|nr:GTP-binding DUF697 domain-containing protein [Oscillospiraceae bacterium]